MTQTTLLLTSAKVLAHFTAGQRSDRPDDWLVYQFGCLHPNEMSQKEDHVARLWIAVGADYALSETAVVEKLRTHGVWNYGEVVRLRPDYGPVVVRRRKDVDYSDPRPYGDVPRMPRERCAVLDPAANAGHGQWLRGWT